MSVPARWSPPFGLLLALAAAGPLHSQVESVGKVTVSSGPHAGSYTVESPTPCDNRPARQGDPAEFRADVASDDAIRERLNGKPRVLTWIRVRVPNLEARHLGELSVSVVFGDPSNRRIPGTAYTIDSTPITGADSLIAQGTGRQLRKSSGRGTAALQKQGKTSSLTFSGQTEQGVRLDGTVECRGNIWEQ